MAICLYLDTNVFVAAIEQNNALSRSIRRLFDLGAERSGLLVTSELTLAELLVKPFLSEEPDSARIAFLARPQKQREASAAFTDSDALSARYAFLFGSDSAVRSVQIDRQILVRAAVMRSRNLAIKLPDALHLATAFQTGCTHIASGDRCLLAVAAAAFETVPMEQEVLESLMAQLA